MSRPPRLTHSSMTRFKGRAEYSIDGKGRVALPAKMRRALSPEAHEGFTITRGFEQCVFLYPNDRWARVEEEFETLNPYQREARAFIRTISSWADDVALDGQGRITIPKNLLEFADLGTGNGSKALILGVHDHIEIWNPDVWQAHVNEQVYDYETVTERVMGGLS